MKTKTIILLMLVILFSTSAFAQNADLSRARKLAKHGVHMEAISEYDRFLRSHPSHIEARIEFVQILMQLNRLDSALPHIDELTWRAPKDPRVKDFQNRIASYRQKLVDKREGEFEQELKKKDVSSSVILDFAQFMAKHKKFDRAEKLYKQYLNAKPDDQVARFELAQHYAWNNRYSESVTQLDKVISRNPDHYDAWFLLGEIQYWRGNNESSLIAYQRAKKIKPKAGSLDKKINKITSTPGFREKQIRQAVAKNPTGPELIDLAIILKKQTRLYEADSLVSKRLGVVPLDKRALALKGEIADLKEAYRLKQIEKYKERLAINPNDSTALLEVAKDYVSLGMLSEAIDKYTLYLETYPEHTEVRLHRAYVYNWATRPDEAINEFIEILYDDVFHREASLGLGEALLSANEDLLRAESIFQEDLIDHPEELRSKVGYAEALRRQGKYDEADVMYLNILETDPENETAINGRDLLRKDFGPLIKHLEQKHIDDPDDVNVRRQLANLYFDSGRYFESEPHVLFILDLEPDNANMLILKKKINGQKELYVIDQIEKTKIEVQEKPFDIDLRIRYADLLAANNLIEDAVGQYRLAVESRPNDIQLQIRLADLYAASHRLDDAIEIYARLAEENPDVFEFRFNLAQVYAWKGEYDTAIFELRLSLRIDPESVEARIALANAYKWKGDIYAAYDEYRIALDKEPENVTANRELNELAGAFFKGAQLQHSQSSDSESFSLTDTRLFLIANYSLRLNFQFGGGRVSFAQDDSSGRWTASQQGNFFFGVANYSYDPFTSLNFEVRYNIFASRQTDWYYVELTRDFKDSPELRGTLGKVYFSSRDAIFDVASSGGLLTWRNRIRAEKFGIAATYNFREGNRFSKVQFDGNGQYMFLSDGNTRTDAWLNCAYRLNPVIDLGLRFDTVGANEERDEYWAPSSYASVIGWISIQKRLQKLSYKLKGGIGRVISTDNSVRQFQLDLGYNINRYFSFGFGYSGFATNRVDGSYRYNGWIASLSWSR